jgi:hypothetical protein
LHCKETGGSVKKSDTIRLGLIALNAFPEDLAEATAAAKAEAIVEAEITDANHQILCQNGLLTLPLAAWVNPASASFTSA